jgi:hypothetical protein
LLVAIVIGSALAVNGALPFGQSAATATATPAPSTATAATQNYTRAGLYQVTYPNSWTATEQNNPPQTYLVILTATGGGATVSITAQQTPVFVDPQVNDTNYLNSLAAPTKTKAKNVSHPEAVTLAKETWTEESGDVTLLVSNGGVQSTQYAHAAVMSANHNGYIYTIVRLAPVTDQAGAASAFASAEQASFQPMLATFRFLS